MFTSVLAGCLDPLEEDPEDDSAAAEARDDPGGPGETGDEGPDPSPGPPGPTDDDEPRTDDDVTRVEAEDTDPDHPGLVLVSELTSSPGTHKVVARGSNDGPSTYRVDVGCSGPRRRELTDAQGTRFYEKQQLGSCQAMEFETFPPGSTSGTTLWWNETRWDQASGRTEQVPAGSYTWTVRFVVWTEDGETEVALATPFTIEVG